METAVQGQIMRAASEWVAILDAIADAVVLVVGGKVVRGNRAFAAATGIELRGLAGISFDHALTLAVGQTIAVEVGTTRIHHDGHVFQVEVRVAPAVHGHVVVLHDVSHEVRAESLASALVHMHDTGLLFAGIRHELRNPLNALGMQLSQLAEQGDTHQLPLVAQCRKQFDRIDRLVSQLRPLNPSHDVVLETLVLHRVVADVVQLAAIEAAARQVVVAVDVRDVAVIADERLLFQVLMNLITNAIEALEHVPPGRIKTVTIAATVVDRHVHLRVLDNGPGVPTHRQPHLFSPFETTKAHGTGLGLYLVAKLMKLMGGSAAHEPTSGGTSILLALPKAAA
jgi:signal transduction histidine kinase